MAMRASSAARRRTIAADALGTAGDDGPAHADAPGHAFYDDMS
jgi:hypothetical protein